MATPDVSLANAIVELINHVDRDFSIDFEAERVWVPEWSKKDELQTLQVAVMPNVNPTAEIFERGELLQVWPMELGFAKHLTDRTAVEIDGLVALVDEVREYLELITIQDDDGRVWQNIGWQFQARFDPTMFERHKNASNAVTYTGDFLSVVTFPFRLLS